MFHIYSQILRALTKSAVNHAQEWEQERVSSKPKVKIENGEVSGCSGNIVDLVIPEGVTGIWSGALSSETQKTLKTVVIPEGVEWVRANTFQDCPNLVSVKLPESITSIRTKAFANCVKLKEINFPEGIIDIAKDAFDNCPHIKVPDLKAQPKPKAQSSHSEEKPPENTAFSQQYTERKMTIENHVLVRCTGKIKKLIVPDGVTKILSNALSSETRTSVEQVYLPDSCVNIGDEAFKDCRNLVSVRLPEKDIVIGHRAFQNCIKLSDINPEHLSYISEVAFRNCPRVKIPEELWEKSRKSDEYNRFMDSIFDGRPRD